MSIISGRNKWILLGILVIIGGAAFVFFDPLGLDLLGQQGVPATAAPKSPPRAVAPPAKPGVAGAAAQPGAATPKAASTPTRASVPAAPTGLPARNAAPVAPTPATTSVVAIQAVGTPPNAMQSQVAAQPSRPAETIKPPNESRKTNKVANKPKDADLRHCLELETNAAIAKCAGE